MKTTHPLTRATMILLATTSVSFQLLLPATADDAAASKPLAPGTDVTTTTTTGVGKYNVPVSETTTTKTILDPGPVKEITKKHTVYTRLSPADASQTITEYKTSTSIDGGKPNLAGRLQNFRSQLDKAIAEKWVSDEQATDLNSESAALVTKEATVKGHDYPKAECDEFDTQANAFNIKLSDAMAKGTKK